MEERIKDERTSRKRRVTGFVVLLLGAASTLATLPNAQAEDSPGKPVESYTYKGPVPDGFSSFDALMKVQHQLDHAARNVVDAAEAAGDTGYSSIKVSVKDHRLSLYWKGSPSAGVQEVLDRLPGGYTFVVNRASYSRIELAKAQQLFTENTMADKAAHISAVYPLPDGSGLGAKAVGDLGAARQLPAVREATVPVTLIPGGEATLEYSRHMDIAPYWGGDLYQTTRDGQTKAVTQCSTAFPVHDLTTGKEEMLTASHCIADIHDKVTVPLKFPTQSLPENRKEVGSILNVDQSYDTAILDMGDLGKRIFRGSPISKSSSPVDGFATNFVGDYVCAGGSETGEHCFLNVEETDVAQITSGWLDGKTHIVFGAVTAQADIGEPAAGHGDSGGPVFTPSDQTVGAVTARGVISSGDIWVSCGDIETEVDPSQLSCGNEVSFVPLDKIVGAGKKLNIYAGPLLW
ncbi:trypsin-like serine protease [Streptomyces sp. NPDC048419]|uniref:trypsin-like serine protease n=1 Tax=Streptomyces sp. NPDC048419 TaxID=3365547 RepID=UPI0037149DBD